MVVLSNTSCLFGSVCHGLLPISPQSPLHLRAFANRCLQWIHGCCLPQGTEATLIVSKPEALFISRGEDPESIQRDIMHHGVDRCIHIHSLPDNRLFDVRPSSEFGGFARLRPHALELVLFCFHIDKVATLAFVVVPVGHTVLHVTFPFATVTAVLGLPELPPYVGQDAAW